MILENFYSIKSQEVQDGNLKVSVSINNKHDVFKGHFPGQPVVPGVCLTQIVKELLETELNESLLMIKGSNLKFMAVVDPDVNPDLLYDITYKNVEDDISASCSAKFDETVAFKFKGTFKKK